MITEYYYEWGVLIWWCVLFLIIFIYLFGNVVEIRGKKRRSAFYLAEMNVRI